MSSPLFLFYKIKKRKEIYLYDFLYGERRRWPIAQLKDLLVSGAARFLNGLNINGDFILAGNLLPAETNKYNLGDSSHRWLQTQTKYLSVGAGDISSTGYEAVISGDLHTTGYSLFDDYVQIGGARPASYKFYVNGNSYFTNYLYIICFWSHCQSIFSYWLFFSFRIQLKKLFNIFQRFFHRNLSDPPKIQHQHHQIPKKHKDKHLYISYRFYHKSKPATVFRHNTFPCLIHNHSA